MHRSVTRAVHGAIGAIFALALGAAVATPARAEEPLRLDDKVTDRVGALDDRSDEVRDAIDRLYQDHRLDLWVVYVDNFSGYDWEEWADLTAVESDLGLNDVLLAVATGDRAYALSVDPQYEITDEQYAAIETIAVEPALRENDWAGAAIGAANGFAAVRSGEEVVAPEITPGDPEPSSGGSAAPWVIGGIAVVGVGAAGVFAVRRRRGTANGARPDQLSTEDLRKHASALLIETDDAIKTSDQEVGFAQAQYGEEAAQPFAAAVAGAREHLDASFAIKQLLDDDQPEDEPTERTMLTEIVERLETANDGLDAQAESFATLRDLERNAPEVLAKTRADADAVAGRIDGARATVSQLAQTYTDAAATPVAENPAQATAQLEFASAAAAEADTKIAAGSTSEAAVRVQAAELAVGQAKELIDAVDKRAEELAKAADGVREALAEVEADVATSKELAAGTAPAGVDAADLAGKAAAAEAVTSTVRRGLEAGRIDPLAALRNLQQSGQELDTALAGARDAQEKAQRAQAALDRTIVSARSRIAATSDFITTRRGAVGGDARTRLVEAQRQLDQAIATAATDPATALQYAQQADGYAQQAEQLAQRDVGGFSGGGPAGGMFGQQSGGSLNSAILGGILGSMLGGGGGGSSRSSGGFGGSSRSRSSPSRSSSRSRGGSRRSRGGRF